MRHFFRNYALYLAWLISLVALFGSLYFSEIQHMPVCQLCWYQRISLYPLALILGIAAFREDHAVGIYAIPLTAAAVFFSGYQYLEQMIPGFSGLQICRMDTPCNLIHFKVLGFVTFPMLSLITSLAIIVLLIGAIRVRKTDMFR